MSKKNRQPTVFISYSHKDEEWKERLVRHLEVLEKQGLLEVWDDRKIDGGETWHPEIVSAMEGADASICLISADYLSSDFIDKEEIPFLLKRRKQDGMLLQPILIHQCLWEAVDWLEAIQMLPRDGQSVVEDYKDREDIVFRDVAKRTLDFLKNTYQPEEALPPKWAELAESCVSIERLPETGAEVFGRVDELAMLDEEWESENANIISFVAGGGVGKSALVNKWVEQMKVDNYRGAERVYGWSFYSQGTRERVTSSEMFINYALEWFGDKEMAGSDKSPWDKGRRLAELVQQKKTLLLLDGLEPLQSGLKDEKGKIKDPAIAVMLGQLAKSNPGLCVVTTREKISGIFASEELFKQKDLEQISAEAGRALLRVGGIRGTDAELEEAVRSFGNHALAINLLVTFLEGIAGRHINEADTIADLDIPVDDGRHPRRVMEAFAERFGNSPEVEVLKMMGLFDKPVEASTVEVIKGKPAIDGLTSKVVKLNKDGWKRVIENLRRVRLIARESHHNIGSLDAHPIVREHFGEKLKENNLDGWCEAHGRLYEYYKGVPKKEQPDTLEEMEPLFAAVAHGCAAGRHQATLNDVYLKRISRGKEAYIVRMLGAFGADLAALAGFFEECWNKPAAGLTKYWKGAVLNLAGFRLQAVGRLREAIEPTKTSIEVAVEQKNWRDAAQSANNLSELYLTLGEIERSVEYAEQSVEYVDKSGKELWRMVFRTTLADVLHQEGEIVKAEGLFREAEEMQRKKQQGAEYLYSVQGYQFCDLLLGQGKYGEVKKRVEKTLGWAKQQKFLLDIGLDNVSIGRAYMVEVIVEGKGDFGKAREYLERGVDGLRKAGAQEFIIRGLLARAEVNRHTGEYKKAWRDVEEAREIAERGEMKLWMADCALEACRLNLAEGEKAKAKEELDKAEELIERCGYHRRDREVEELAI